MVSNADVPPGGEAKIEVKVSTKGRKGKMSKSITVETDDAVTPKLSLKFKLNVLVELDFAKPYARFNKIRKDETAEQTSKIIIAKPDKIKFGKVTSTVDGLSGKIEKKTDQAGKTTFSLLLKFTPKKIGRINGQVKVLTNHPKHEELVMKISANVSGDIQVTPARLNMWLGQPENKGNTFTVKSANKSFKIKKISEDKSRMDASFKVVKKGHEYLVTVKVNKTGKELGKSFSGKLIISTDNKEQAKLEVPVYYSNRERKSRTSFPVKQKRVDPRKLTPIKQK